MNPMLRLAALGALAILAAGGALYLVGGGRSGPPPGPTVAPTSIEAPTPLPTASPSGGACSLVTSKEVETLAGNPGLGAQPFGSGTGNVTTCSYSDGGGNLVLRVTYTATGGGAEFGLVESSPGVQVVTDVGDAAVFDPDTDTLYVRTGDALLAIFASALFQDADDRLRMETEVGKVAAGRV